MELVLICWGEFSQFGLLTIDGRDIDSNISMNGDEVDKNVIYDRTGAITYID